MLSSWPPVNRSIERYVRVILMGSHLSLSQISDLVQSRFSANGLLPTVVHGLAISLCDVFCTFMREPQVLD